MGHYMTETHQAIVFEAYCFDYKSKSKASYEGHTRHYGKDVAEHLCERLSEVYTNCCVNESFWGWLVSGQEAASSEFEITVQNLSRNGPLSSDEGSPQWGLWVHCFVFQTYYEVVRVRIHAAVPPELMSRLRKILEEAGATLSAYAPEALPVRDNLNGAPSQ